MHKVFRYLIGCVLAMTICSVQGQGTLSGQHTDSLPPLKPIGVNYDGFGLGLKANIGFLRDSEQMPDNLFGGILGLDYYITDSRNNLHQFSLCAGWMCSEEKTRSGFIEDIPGFQSQPLPWSETCRLDFVVPVMAGYTFNWQVWERKLYLYAGGQVGVTFYTWQNTMMEVNHLVTEQENGATFTGAFHVGLRVPINPNTHMLAGYEWCKMKKLKACHCIQAGVCWFF